MQHRFINVLRQLRYDGHIKNDFHLSKLLGCYSTQISRMKNGTQYVGSHYIEKLNQLFNVNPNYIFGVSDEIYLK